MSPNDAEAEDMKASARDVCEQRCFICSQPVPVDVNSSSKVNYRIIHTYVSRVAT